MRRAKSGVRQMIFNTLAADADAEWPTLEPVAKRSFATPTELAG
jgi:hypothetical protein